MSTFKPDHRALNLSTKLVHASRIEGDGFKSQAVPVYRGSSTFFDSTEAQRAHVDVLGLDYSYGLHGNPTQYTLAQHLAHIEGARHALLCPSGLAAITLVATACLKHGDHWLIPGNVYGPVQTLARQLHADYGVQFGEYNPCDLASVKAALQPNTRLVWTEAPGSLTFEVPDLQAIVALAKFHGARTGIDNTWSAGLAFKPFEHGFDFSVQALTKYQCGHADVLMGAVLANDTQAFAEVERRNRVFGLGVGPDDCSLVLRGLLTLPLRFEHQGRQALELAKRLQSHPAIAHVLHPALPSCPGHANFARLFSGSASIFSVVLQPQVKDEQACAVVDALKLFSIAYSWGGPESLALVVNIPAQRRRELSQQLAQKTAHACGPILRLAIGLEDLEDLWSDLQEALALLS
ncbi:PLP-dependent transferase [Limnobacter sp.]|uniref:PLP-dependent transferase n=1 Tax=Limnobacter sp. TaxID=2003368 RepID=UPI003512CC76